MKNILLVLGLLITLTVSAQNPIVVSQTYTPQASAPALTEGRVYYDNIAKVLYVYNGTSWVDLTASASLTFTGAASSPGNSTWLGFNAGANDDATDNFNVGIGVNALNALTYQIHHTAVGYEAGSSISGDSFDNSIFGYRAGEDLTSGDYNVLLGSFAGDNLVGNQDHNVFIGYNAGSDHSSGTLTTATTSIAIGSNTKMNANSETNQIVIGYGTTGNGSNTVTIGNSSITENYFNGTIKAFNSEDILPATTLSYDLGSSSFRYLDGYINAIKAGNIEGIVPNSVVLVNTGFRYSSYDKALITPGKGDVLWDSTLDDLVAYDGASWNSLTDGGGGSLPVSDATSIVEGNVDPTKEARFEVDGLTTGTVRVLTVQDADGTIAYSADIPTISDVAYNATTWNANTDGASKNAIRDEMETKVINTVSGRTGQAVNGGILIQTEAQIDTDGTVGTGEVVFCSDCSPMAVISTADWNTANGAVTMSGWQAADDRTIDEGTITLSDCDPGEALTVYILRTSAPTLAGTGLTFNNIGTVSFTTATEQKIEFEVAIDGTTIDYFYVDR